MTATIVGTYRKMHIPGHEDHEPERPFQHLERYYFEESPDGFGVWRAFDGVVGAALCNDRRWPETYRVMGLQGVELIVIGYNTPLHYAPDPTQNALAGFHNHLVMQSGAYQNGTWVVGVAKGGIEEGVDSLAQSVIIAPSGQIVAQAVTTGDELIVARCDLDFCACYKDTLFDFDHYRRPEHYRLISERKGHTYSTAPSDRERNTRWRRSPSTANEITVGDHHEHLLDALRLEAGITSTKDGCAPSGQCGCCTVLIDGKARVACVTGLDKVEGAEVTTLEGFDPLEVDRYANAFAAHGALQCGFCTPGIVVRAKSLIDKKGAELTREEASRHLGGHLCRCTGYIKILDAVESLARGDIDVPVTVGGVGTRGVKYEGCSLAVGRRPFIADMNPAGCLHGAFRLADHARADVVRIDTTRGARHRRGRGRVHRRRRARRAARRADPQGLAGVHPRGRAHVVPRRRARHRRRRRSGHGPPSGCRDRRHLRRPAAGRRRRARPRQRRRGVGTRRQPAVALRLHPGRLRTGLRGLGAHRARGVPDPTRRARLRRTGDRRSPCRPTTAACTCTPAGRACGTTATTSPRCSASIPAKVTVELVSNGGAFGGKEDMSNQAQTALAAWLLRRAGEGHRSPASSRCCSTRSGTRSASSTGPAATPTGR